MAILKILKVPNIILKTKTEEVLFVDDDVRCIMKDMLDTMYRDSERGVGLAANQVGILKKIIVIDLQEDDDIKRPDGFYPLFMANPEIIYFSKEKISADEGCLSVPGQRIEVSRSIFIKTRYLDYNNKLQELDSNGWLSRVIQHEVDHLNGKTLIDHLSNLKRNVIMRKIAKLQKVTM